MGPTFAAMPKPDYITSDVHLGAVPPDTEAAFLTFLEHAGQEAGRLMIVGDLFDFWFEYGEIIMGRHFRVLAALAALVDAGVPVLLTGGNHDAWGGRFLREHVGVQFHPDQVRTLIAGRPALLAHGDGLGEGDLRYRALKAVIRSRPMIGAFRVLHPELGLRIARRVSSTQEKSSGDADPGAGGRARFIQEWATRRLRADPELAWVVCGHAHAPAIEEVAPGRHYVNAGDWLTHWSYVSVAPDGRPTLQRWAGG
jgi:UDP-2,3-diacylglucosamine hydrolase